MAVSFVWDKDKNQRNLAKHGVSFESAILVFSDPLMIAFPERIVEGEQRWHSIGSAGGIVIVTVAHTVALTDSGEVIRIISARKATPSERKRYEETD
jgi:uncharacterized DUF497 family protein